MPEMKDEIYVLKRVDNGMLLGVYYDAQAAINEKYPKWRGEKQPVTPEYFAGRRSAYWRDGGTSIEKLWVCDSHKNRPVPMDIEDKEP